MKRRRKFKKGDWVKVVSGGWAGKTTTLTTDEDKGGLCFGFYCGQLMMLKGDELQLEKFS